MRKKDGRKKGREDRREEYDIDQKGERDLQYWKKDIIREEGKSPIVVKALMRFFLGDVFW